MLNAIPFVGWVMDFGFKVSLAIPFWIIWTFFGLGEKYFYFLPTVYRAPGFWDCVGFFIAVPILYAIVIPTIVRVVNTQTVGSENKPKQKPKTEQPQN
jgi:hypothetical protein